MVCRCW